MASCANMTYGEDFHRRPSSSHRAAQGPGEHRVLRINSRDDAVSRFNTFLALKITAGVGTMWCAYAFAALALVSLPHALHAGLAATITWTAQTFLQLVLLSIIIVGQNVQSGAADARAETRMMRMLMQCSILRSRFKNTWRLRTERSQGSSRRSPITEAELLDGGSSAITERRKGSV